MASTTAKALARKLMTQKGLREELAQLYEELTLECTRDQVSALNARKHILGEFRELQKDAAETQMVETLTAKLAELEARMADRDDGSTSFSEAPAIPSRDGAKPH